VDSKKRNKHSRNVKEKKESERHFRCAPYNTRTEKTSKGSQQEENVQASNARSETGEKSHGAKGEKGRKRKITLLRKVGASNGRSRRQKRGGLGGKMTADLKAEVSGGG